MHANQVVGVFFLSLWTVFSSHLLICVVFIPAETVIFASHWYLLSSARLARQTCFSVYGQRDLICPAQAAVWKQRDMDISHCKHPLTSRPKTQARSWLEGPFLAGCNVCPKHVCKSEPLTWLPGRARGMRAAGTPRRRAAPASPGRGSVCPQAPRTGLPATGGSDLPFSWQLPGKGSHTPWGREVKLIQPLKQCVSHSHR